MKNPVILISMALAMCACHQNPFLSDWDTPYGIPPFDKIRTSDFLPAVKAGIAEQNAEVQAIIDNPAYPDFNNTIAALDRSGNTLAKVVNVLFNVSESDATDEINKVVEKATPIISEHSDNISMNTDLFERVRKVFESDQSKLSAEQLTLLQDTYDSFVKNGVALDEASRARLKEINSELSSLALTFGNNLLAESNSFMADLGFSVSNYYDQMASVEDRALREKIFNAYSRRGNNSNDKDNKATVLRTMELRIEKARLLGFDNPASMILDDKMAGNPETVETFLEGIMKAAIKCAGNEISEMQALMDRDIASGLLPEGSTIQPWDYMYYMAKLRKEKYDLDETEVMKYFQMENVRKGVFANATRLYGVQFEPIEGVALHNAEAEAFKVTDADGSLVGVLITDYYPRETKRGGAWMTNYVEQYIREDGSNVRPVIVNIGNFNKPTADQPSLLTIDQVETMFHEFGHAIHGLLSQCTYRSLSGTSTKRDFVELPSQINENWAFQPEVLSTYAFHYETGEVIPQALVDKMLASMNCGMGFSTTELCAASILDMKWHELSSIEGVDLEEFEKKVCSEMGLPDEIIPRYRSTYFNHIFGSSGYSAGYYSYLWAEVLDKDAFELFKEKGIYDTETAMSFRRNILEKGGSEDPMVLYRRFRGADPDSGALLRARGLE